MKRAKATAALHGERQAPADLLKRRPPEAGSPLGWRSVFGKARRKAVEQVDAIVAAEFERIEPEDWR